MYELAQVEPWFSGDREEKSGLRVLPMCRKAGQEGDTGRLSRRRGAKVVFAVRRLGRELRPE